MKVSAGKVWAQMASEKEFVITAMIGMAIVFVISIIIFFIASRNVILTLFTLIAKILVILSITAIIKMKGWEFGMLESHCLVVLFGFSIAYIYYYAIAYNDSPLKIRHEKMRHAYHELGKPIFQSFCANIVACFFLFRTELYNNQKFAFLFLSTLISSLFVSNYFFGSILHVIGPELDQGMITLGFLDYLTGKIFACRSYKFIG